MEQTVISYSVWQHHLFVPAMSKQLNISLRSRIMPNFHQMALSCPTHVQLHSRFQDHRMPSGFFQNDQTITRNPKRRKGGNRTAETRAQLQRGHTWDIQIGTRRLIVKSDGNCFFGMAGHQRMTAAYYSKFFFRQIDVLEL